MASRGKTPREGSTSAPMSWMRLIAVGLVTVPLVHLFGLLGILIACVLLVLSEWLFGNARGGK